MRIAVLLTSVLLLFVPAAQAQRYSPLADASTVSFKIKNFGVLVEGIFSGIEGTIIFKSNELISSSFNVTVDASTVDTGIALRNKHLRKEDYFDVKNYPTIKFVSSSVKAGKQQDEYTVTGKLTIKKISKEITFPFLIKEEGDGLVFKGSFTIKRRDFEVGGNSFSMADEVTVYLTVNAGSSNAP